MSVGSDTAGHFLGVARGGVTASRAIHGRGCDCDERGDRERSAGGGPGPDA